MFNGKQMRCITLLTLFAFIFSTMDYNYGQDESPLIRAQDLYHKGNFIEAIKVLNTFVIKIQNNHAESKRLGEAYYLLAHIHYDSGEETKADEYLQQALHVHSLVGKWETDQNFKFRLEQIRKKLGIPLTEDEGNTSKTVSKNKIGEDMEPEVKEKEDAPQLVKKRKGVPWPLIAIGVGAIAILIVLMAKKKQSKPSLPKAEYELKIPTAIMHYYTLYKEINIIYNTSISISERAGVDGKILSITIKYFNGISDKRPVYEKSFQPSPNILPGYADEFSFADTQTMIYPRNTQLEIIVEYIEVTVKIIDDNGYTHELFAVQGSEMYFY